MKDFLVRISSRKFLLTISTGIALYANKQYLELVILILGYFGINVADYKAKVS